MIKKILNKLSKDLGIDLGTSSTLVYLKGQGIVIREPSIIAINTRTDQIVAIGQEAKAMLGKTPPHIEVTRPLRDGVVSDFEAAEKMLKYFINKVHQEGFNLYPRPRVVISIPLGVTEVERKAVEDAVLNAGGRQVFLIEEPIAAAIGARLPIQESIGNLIVDIGGGTTEIAVIALGGVVTWRSLRIAGDELTEDIVNYLRDQFNLLVGESTAEEVKIKIGSVVALKQPLKTPVRGRDLISGLPKEMTITSEHVREAISRTIRMLIDNIQGTIEETPPELVGDIYKRGIVLTGGGALLKGLDKILSFTLKIPVRLSDDPLTCVVRGCGMILEDIEASRELFTLTTPERGVEK